VTPGALVTANQAQALATVQQLDPIYVDLTQSSADMLRLRGEIAAGRLQAGAKGEVPVKLILEDGSEYAAEGRLALSEVTVDEGTGSVTLRAQFSNADGVLLPGMYVRARLPQGTRSEAILVPHKALSATRSATRW
jgi:membrane fusion protein (multidrug efflux system)